MSNWQSRLTTTVNILVIVAAIGLIGAGPARKRFQQYRVVAAERAAIRKVWSELSQAPMTHGRDSDQRVLVEFGDYQCPGCRSDHRNLRLIADSLDLKIVYRHFPIKAAHPQAESAARAAICADEQERFTAMHNYLYESDEWMENPNWIKVAELAGVRDTTAFSTCLDSERTTGRLNRDQKLAMELSVQGTPTYIGAKGMALGIRGIDSLASIVK